MTRSEFQKLAENIIYLDGATGSNLVKRGMPAGVCPETWILEHPEALIGLQEEYLAAGTNIILAPTFTSNRIKLKEYGLENQIDEINIHLTELSKEAIRRHKINHPNAAAFVAADLTMTGQQLSPMGTMDFEELVSIYKEQLNILIKSGVDLVFIETMMSLQETRAAVLAVRELCDLPVIASLTFENDGRTLYGTDALTVMSVLQSLGADAVGTNCSTGPDKMLLNVQKMAKIAQIPIVAKPNAGLPQLCEDGSTVYQMTPEEFAKEMLSIIDAGASVIGGCCGTTPAHIQALVNATSHLKPNRHKIQDSLRYLSSEKETVLFDLDSPFMIVGERINPTGKKKLQAELRDGNLDLVYEFAVDQEEQGASLLDINMGMSGIDEKEMMLKAIEEVTTAVRLPLVIDSSHIDVIEQALRRYPGRALINSISYEKIKFDNLLPIAKKYGAMFILLPLSDEGLPKSLDEKKEIIHRILERAYELGISRNNIVVDGLVATVGANKLAALETLETIRYCKQELKLPTIIGLSNISFGLPERSNVNSSFLSLAIQAGLTMAISNPSQQQLVASAYAADMLLNKPDSDIRYIQFINTLKENYPDMAPMGTISIKQTSVQQSDVSQSIQKGCQAESAESSRLSDSIYKAVLSGNKKSIVSFSQIALDNGREAKEILDESLLPAINEVGHLFETGKYFLPQLIAGAEAMKLAIEFLEPLLIREGSSEKQYTVVIASVKGDIHDIGKNLVALMLKNYGFKVIDLGKDVAKEDIIQATKEHHAHIIALSALMTTTMQEMKEVVALAKKEGLQSKIMIGGAVITQEYADEIQADGYSKDAQEAVKLAQKLTMECTIA